MRQLLMTAVVVTSVAIASGCGMVSYVKDGVWDPMTPEEAKAQTIAAARDVVKTLRLKDVGATFRFEACSDQGEPPYRGLVQIQYAHAATYEESQEEVRGFAETLQRDGWSADSGFRSHSPSLEEDKVIALLRPYSPNGGGGIEVRGECRDVSDHRGKDDIVNSPITADVLE